jgi:hypothetical protein
MTDRQIFTSVFDAITDTREQIANLQLLVMVFYRGKYFLG